MWKRILFLTIGLSIGAGAGFLGSQYLSSTEAKGKKSHYLSRNSSSRHSLASSHRKASSKVKRNKKTAAKKQKSNIKKANHKKSKSKRKGQHRAEINGNSQTNLLASTEVMPIPSENPNTPWINDLSGESARLNMQANDKSEAGCNDERCYGDRDRAIALVGVVVETNDLSPRNQATLVDGDFDTGDGQSRPAIYVR